MDDQHLRLRAALGMVGAAVSDAVAITVQTSDQNHYGFWLSDVVHADGSALSRTDPGLLARLIDDTRAHLGDLDWDHLVAEDDTGYALILLPGTRPPS